MKDEKKARMAIVLPSRRRVVRDAAERGQPGPVLQALAGHVKNC